MQIIQRAILIRETLDDSHGRSRLQVVDLHLHGCLVLNDVQSAIGKNGFAHQRKLNFGDVVVLAHQCLRSR